MKQYVDNRMMLTESPEQFHIASILTVLGCASGRRVAIEYGGRLVYPNLYTLLHGPAGNARKDTAMNLAEGMYPTSASMMMDHNAPRARYHKIMDTGSAEALIGQLSEDHGTLFRLSEWAEIAAIMKREGAGNLQPLLLKLFDTPDTVTNTTKGKDVTKGTPTLSILSGTQPDIFLRELSGQAATSGLVSRLMIVPGRGRGGMPVPGMRDRLFDQGLWADMERMLTQYRRNSTFTLSPAAQDVWIPWYHSVESSISQLDPLSRPSGSRTPLLALKIALIYSSLDEHTSPSRPMIDAEHLEPAIRWASWILASTDYLLRRFQPDLENRIELRISDALMASSEGLTRRDILDRARDRDWPLSKIDRVLTTMQKASMVGEVTGALPVRYRLIKGDSA